jgi:hypothetical protein
MRKTLFIIVMLLARTALPQVFPLQVSSQLVPPYSPYLSDYAAPGSQVFMVQVRANDLTLTNYPFKLRIRIEGVGIDIRTRHDFTPPPLVLHGGGIPEILYGEDLAAYFDADALDFSGYSRVEYQRTARLPEGVYRFSVEVLDYYRGSVVSNTGATTAWIILNDPPVLNLPAQRSTVIVQDPQSILFTWTPRHTGSPNAAFTTAYTFTLVEIWPDQRNPNDAFLTQSPLYETSTTQNQILYGATEPALLPGRTYAWQVTARDTGGKDLFKNHGASEVFVFKYGEKLAAPENLLLRWAKPTTLAIRWDAVRHVDEEVRYRLQYRPRRRTSNDSREWYETRTKFTDKTLYDLEPATEYEVKVRTELISQQSEFTETAIFKTLKEEPAGFVCSDGAAPPPAPADTKPVFPLSINDTIHAGGYDVLVRDVLGIEGKYTGSGLAIVPWLNSAKVRVSFENISVNDRFWLTRGAIKSVWNADSKFLFKVETPIDPGEAPKTGEIAITVVAADTLITIQGAAISAVTREEDGAIVVHTTDGATQVLPKGQQYAVADEVGNGYIIDKQGNIAKTTAAEAHAAAARSDREYDRRFVFQKGEGQYGFDDRQLDALSQYYQQLDDGSYVAWKALATSHQDALAGQITAGDADPAHITFQAGSSQTVPFSSSDNNFSLRLFGRAAGMEEELVALFHAADSVPDRALGKINLVTYNLMQYHLVIVPVNAASMPADLSADRIAESLNSVYRQAVAEWSVTVDKSLTVSLGETFDEGETGLLTNYTGDMKKVLNAYGHLLKNTFYLFLIERPRDPSTLGYMPRNRQAGFIFIEPHQGNAAEFVKTLAHELGHGAFNLKHIFSEHGVPIGSTDNLMDYSSGTTLCKYQWDAIHHPQSVLGLFDEEGENAMENVTEPQPLSWWQLLPPYERAARLLKKHFEATKLFKSVEYSCNATRCVVSAELSVNDSVSYTTETTFLSTTSTDDLLYALAFEYHVDLWESFDVKAEDIWDQLYYWWRKQNDDLAAHKGWQISGLNFLADVITSTTMVPAVEGWVTGKHWRDGHDLAGWEQGLAVLDVLAAEELTKGFLTKLVLKVGRKSINLLKIPAAAKELISNSIENGLKVTAISETEFLIKGVDETAIARIVNENLYLLHEGREILINLSKRTTLLGRFVAGTENFILAKFHNSSLFNMLNVKWAKETSPLSKIIASDANKNAVEFWQSFNKRFIDDAITKGDDITLLTRPDDLSNLFYRQLESREFIDTNGKIIQVTLTGRIDQDVQALLSKNAFPTMFGREVIYLAKKLELSVSEVSLKFFK